MERSSSGSSEYKTVIADMKINIAKDFSPVPSGRYLSDGPDSGERFRNEFLLPAIESGDRDIQIDIDGTAGYGSSFLEEAFGGLIRVCGVDRNIALSSIKIISEDPDYEMYKELIQTFLEEA